MRVAKYIGYWNVNVARTHPDMMFIFGCNNVRLGRSGQAVIRDEPNAFGIPTKKYSNNNETSFYTDLEYEKNVEKIDAAIQHIKNNLHKFKGVMYPAAGLGTGLSQLDKRAPRTFRYLNRKIDKLFKEIANIE